VSRVVSSERVIKLVEGVEIPLFKTLPRGQNCRTGTLSIGLPLMELKLGGVGSFVE
jgi:hypothetical protein